MNAPDIWTLIQEIAQFLNHIATIVIGALGAWIAYQTLLRTPKQEDRSTEKTGDSERGAGPAKAQLNKLVLFETSKQKTTLMVEGVGLVSCYLFNKTERKPKLQWTLGKAAIARILASNDIKAHADFRPRSGRVQIGPKRNWLYTRNLFRSEEDLEGKIELLLQTALEEDGPSEAGAGT